MTRRRLTWIASHALAERLAMPSSTARAHKTTPMVVSSSAVPLRHDPTAGLYPWNHDHDAAPVDLVVLATWRADQLAAHLAHRLEWIANTLDGSVADLADVTADGLLVSAATGVELHALGLCAVHIRHFLADVTRLAGASVTAGGRP